MAEYRATRANEGIRMPDGAIYDAGRTGRIRVDNPRHIAAIERDAAVREGHIHAIAPYAGTSGTAHRDCPVPGCRFRGYGWQQTCPRDGATLVVPVLTTAQ